MTEALPAFDVATLRGHLETVADTLATMADGNVDTRRLRECATVTARIAKALGPRAVRAEVSAAAELDALLFEEARFADAQGARHRDGATPQAQSVRLLDPGSLEGYLRQTPAGGKGLILASCDILAGGRCKLTARLRISGAAQLPDKLILRQDWEGGATETTVADEYRLLGVLADAGLLVPRPYLIEPASSAVGLPFILMEDMPGRLEAGLFEPPSGPELAIALAGQLARLHAVPLEAARTLGLPETGDVAGIEAALGQFAATHQSIGIGSSIIDAALAWLAGNLGQFGQERALTHNDVGFHNCLTDGTRLTALLDWELATIGHPAADLGYIKHFVQRMMPWDGFLAAYAQAGGRTYPAETLRFHTIWNAVRLYGLIMRARHAIASGLVRDIEISHACADNLLQLLAFLGEELAKADCEG